MPRLALLSAACVAVAACSPTFDWRESRSAEGLVALFPCKPDSHTRKVVIAGLPLPMRLSSCAADDTTFAVSQVEAAEASQVTPLMQALQATLLDNVRGSAAAGAEALPLPAVADVPGATPHPLAQRFSAAGQRADGSPLQAQGQFFCKGLRVYQATVVGRRLDAAALDVFFSSLKLSS